MLTLLDVDWKPRILIADNAPAIANGFIEAFGRRYIEILTNWRANCWAHAIRNIDIELSHIQNKENKDKIGRHIVKIQILHTTKLFEKATKLFYSKWSNIDVQTTAFINYFNNNWVLSKSGYYEGFQIGIPSQSNAIESAHRHDIKGFGNIKNRTTCMRFMSGDGRRVVQECSLERCETFRSGM